MSTTGYRLATLISPDVHQCVDAVLHGSCHQLEKKSAPKPRQQAEYLGLLDSVNPRAVLSEPRWMILQQAIIRLWWGVAETAFMLVRTPQIWNWFGRAEVDLFASPTHCPLWFSLRLSTIHPWEWTRLHMRCGHGGCFTPFLLFVSFPRDKRDCWSS